jgi:hypothetical protein
MEDYHYKAILNNIFRCLHNSPLKSLSQLAQEKILINICMEMNKKSFLFIYDCIMNNTKDNMKDIVSKIISDLESVVSEKNIKNKCEINIKKIIVLEETELKHLSQLLIVYGLLLAEKKLIYIQTVKTCFNYTLRKNIYLIVNYYMKPDITILKLDEEDEEEEESEDSETIDINQEEQNISKKTSDQKKIKRKKEHLELKKLEKEIEAKASDLTLKFGGINSKIKQNNKYIEKNINKIQKLKLTKSKVNTLEIKALNKSPINNNNKKKISMNLINEKEKAIETLENKISNIQNEYKDYKNKKEKEINDMKNKVSSLLNKLNILEKKKVLLKDYNELKEKSNKYDDLIVKYKKLKKIVDEKWDLTEQQYLDIISKKDEEILRLKEALSLSERQSMMNGNNTMKMNNNFGNSLFMDNESIGDNSINYTEFGFSINNNNNYFNNKNNNIMNSNNNLLLSANNSEINLKDIKDINIKDEEEKK